MVSKRPIAFVHTSPAAIAPLMQYYTASAPDLEIYNLLDDGILRYFTAGDAASAERRLADMLSAARREYAVYAALVTCSAVTRDLCARLSASNGVPVIKIDAPMAEQAVALRTRLGVIVTFPPTEAATTRLLEEAAGQAGVPLDLETRVIPEAYRALLSGDPAIHDMLLIEAAESFAGQGVGAIVLSQVSMARVLPMLQQRLAIPVLSSLPTSLSAIRQAL